MIKKNKADIKRIRKMKCAQKMKSYAIYICSSKSISLIIIFRIFPNPNY